MSEWKRYKISDFADVIGGGTPSTKIEEYYGGSIPWLTPKDMSTHNEKYIEHGARNITELGLQKSSARLLPKGTVLFTSRAPIGYIAITKGEVSTNQGFKSLICDEKIAHNEYIYYLLKSKVKEIESIASGSTFKEVSGKVLKEFTVELPPLQTQKKIAHILSTLDEKIELNRKMNETLEKMAQAIFKSWFVDFEPVHAKAKCKNEAELEAAAKELGISKEILELFPSEFEESELGMIPKGWEYDILSNHITVTKGKSYKSSELQESRTALVTLKSFLRGGGYRMDGIKPYTGKYKDEQIIQPGELIIAYTDVTQAADIIGKPAIVLPDESIDILVASLDVGIVRTKTQKINIMFLYHLFKTKRFQGYILGHTSGTTVLHLSKGWLDGYNILLPSQEIMDRYNELVSSLFNKMRLNIEEIRSLQKTRDTLLPKLLSGELDLSKLDLEAGL